MDWLALTRSYSVWDEAQIRGFFGEYRWLSNFEPAVVCFNGHQFLCVEAAYQAQKDRKRVNEFEHLNGKESKKLGKQVAMVDNWEQIKYDIMAYCVFDKFYRNPQLHEKLLATGDRYLEETNHWNDMYWGVDYRTNLGQNKLGAILMLVRAFWQAKHLPNRPLNEGIPS